MKVIVHTKTGEILAYESAGSYKEVRDFWEKSLSMEAGVTRFGRYVMRLDNIDFVEIRET